MQDQKKIKEGEALARVLRIGHEGLLQTHEEQEPVTGLLESANISGLKGCLT